ncbi:hypothetical protein ASE01_01550 [Nocardioides sp. Root190]|uniref:hypothetical protein n=1 Tax=Nocardioides sp. Root190 TaxID=1736488 RepID=UPI0006F20F07|nr:hypothetical protein [Nocardioides sp. Root190]KRB80207.1 hypothetical protein ASE01_01550 [Nocardioides sp. Root190]
MHPRVLAALAANGGLITRAQALDLGVGPGEIRAYLHRRRGEDEPRWRVLRRGIYTTTEIWNALDQHVGRPLLVARACGLAARRGWVLSHDSSCHLQRIPVLRPDVPLSHLTRPGWTNAWTEYGIKHHLARFDPDQVVDVEGTKALDLARTAVDMGREHGLRHGLVACDAVMRRGVSRQELEAALEVMVCWPGRRAAQRAVAVADPGAESVLESLARELVIEAGVGEPETQFPMRTERGIAWCDIRVGNQVIESDGEVKYTPVDRGGLSEDPRRTVFEEKLRERAVADRRFVVTRLVWEDHWGRRRAEAIARVQRDHAEAIARFGPMLPEEMAREAERIRRQYGDRRSA